jgi:hypothetical protein
MLQIPKGTDLAVTAQGRIATLDRAYRHHAVGGAAPLGHQLHPLWPWRQDGLARLRSRRAVQSQFLYGLHVFHFWIVRSRQPGAQTIGKFPRLARLAIGCTIFCLDLHPDAGCLLSDLPALPFTGNNGLQFPSFLVAPADDWSLAVRVGVVLVGVAGARCESPPMAQSCLWSTRTTVGW